MASKLSVGQWGRRIQLKELPDLYAPTKIQKHFATPGGIDNLSLSSTDVFEIPGQGKFSVNFKGYFRVARSNPTSSEWASAEWSVNMVDLRLEGSSKELGPMSVRLNPDVVSAGQVFATGNARAAKACRIATGATFRSEKLGLVLFNKEPILLMNDAIDSVPPVEDPDGQAHIYRLPLFSTSNPEGLAMAYLISLRYTVGNYITEAQAAKFRRLK